MGFLLFLGGFVVGAWLFPPLLAWFFGPDGG
jgi:hypothetical protein